AQEGPLRAATGGFSLALAVAAAVLVLGAALIAALLGKKHLPEGAPDTAEAPVTHADRT
ncbi:MFS transporter, partial [Streptomyces sp. SID7499]|nr:MFS transporter [Streptomyces sp. SID7499]